ncbi:MAG: hypothetical protein KDE48_04145 [Anaerolineales bacterium]|nr:hypothetical protein [Anaerolineales bacterium]
MRLIEPTTAVPTIIPTLTNQPTSLPTDAAVLNPTATPLTAVIDTPVPYGFEKSIGKSHQGRDIVSYQFKNGPNKVLFVGGMHGGYEWNSIVLAYHIIDYFMANPADVPDSVSLIVIPSANPDGQYLVTQKEGRFQPEDVKVEDTFPGRFNAIGVDLNRNWDCDWREDAVWRNQPVNAGTHPFSEPETQALRDYIWEIKPRAVIFWHSSANGVYAARCPELFLPALQLGEVFGEAANYPVHEYFDYYRINGDASDWLVTQNIPSITVELRTTKGLDWPQNLAGTQAALDYYAQQSELFPKNSAK